MGTKKQEREEKVLFPDKEVRLLSGESVIVSPWPIKRGRIQTQRVFEIGQKLSEHLGAEEVKEAGVAEALDFCEEEVALVVRDTLGWTDEQLDERCAFEDLLDLAQAVWDTSVAREGGGGVLPKLMRLMASVQPLRPASPAQ